MQELKKSLKDIAVAMIADLDKDSKAANARVRKATLQIAKIGKQFRAESIKAEKI